MIKKVIGSMINTKEDSIKTILQTDKTPANLTKKMKAKKRSVIRIDSQTIGIRMTDTPTIELQTIGKNMQ